MSLVDQATGIYMCDGCGKTIVVYEAYLWGDPAFWSEYCYDCHTAMCRQRIKNVEDVDEQVAKSKGLCPPSTTDIHETYFGSGEIKVDNAIVQSSKWCPDHMRFAFTSKGDPVGCRAEYEHESQQKAKIEQEKDMVDLKALAERALKYAEMDEVCDSPIEVRCDDCPIGNRPDSRCSDAIRKEWATKYLAELNTKETKPVFAPKTRGGLEYRIYAMDGGLPFEIHGAINTSAGWRSLQWNQEGEHLGMFTSCSDYDLLPLKKRRFKTAEELVANRYGSVEFLSNGNIIVKHCGLTTKRFVSDTPEGNYSEIWKDIFTVEEA